MSRFYVDDKRWVIDRANWENSRLYRIHTGETGDEEHLRESVLSVRLERLFSKLHGPSPYISHHLCMIGQICDETRLLVCRCGTPWHLETRECLNDYLTAKVAKRSRWARG